MSEQNIYQEHYELQKAFASHQETIQNIYSMLAPLVSPHAVNLSLQEVIDLTVQALQKAQEPTLEQPLTTDEQVASEAHAVVPEPRAARSKK